MTWDVEYTDELGGWWASLTEDEQASVAASVQLLEARGGMGGELEVIARFPEGSVKINNFTELGAASPP